MRFYLLIFFLLMGLCTTCDIVPTIEIPHDNENDPENIEGLFSAVFFESNGGSDVEVQIAEKEEPIDEPIPPVKTGYTFAGWYKDSSLTSLWVFETDLVTENIILYAKWTVNQYSVSFNTDGGSAVVSQTVDYGGTVTRPSDPVRTGFVFVNWYFDSGLSDLWDFTLDTVTADMTLYAKWTQQPVYTVTFQYNTTLRIQQRML